MGKITKEAYICMVSGIWAVVVVFCSVFDLIDMRNYDDFFGTFTKVSTAMLGVVQFMLSAKLLAYNKMGAQAELAAGRGTGRCWYYCFLLLAITMTLVFTFFYVFKERNYYHTYWGFSFYDMIIFFDVAIFVAFAVFHSPPPKSVMNRNKPNGRMQTEWIHRNMTMAPPERVIVGRGVAEHGDMKVQSTNSDLPYARMQDAGDSFA